MRRDESKAAAGGFLTFMRLCVNGEIRTTPLEQALKNASARHEVEHILAQIDASHLQYPCALHIRAAAPVLQFALDW